MTDDRIPLVDLGAQARSIRSELDAAIREIFSTTSFVGGSTVSKFEDKFAAYCEVEHTIGCGNGTDAICLTLLAMEIGVGDEVITTPHTFFATAEAISMSGATPVFVDVEKATGLMDLAHVASAVSDKTRAIVPVHLYGQPLDVPLLRDRLGERPDIRIIEDAAQAHGARIHGQRVGSFGDAACFSFYPGKNLGAAGDAGAIVTNDKSLAARARMLANHGRLEKYKHELVGVNSRLDAIQAGILNVKLAHIDKWTDRRQQVADIYREKLASSLPEIRCLADREGAESVWHVFVVRVENRDAVLAGLHERGVGAGVHYPIPLHLQPAYSHLGLRKGQYPQTESWAQECLSLPLFPEITESQIDRVVTALGEAMAHT